MFELKASEPPLKIEQLPDFKHNAATSAVTLGLLSYITPITPIGVVTFLIVKFTSALVGLRAGNEAETEGLDLAEHGERGYN